MKRQRLGTVPVTGTLVSHEIHLDESFFVASDYIDASGNVTMRIEVPGPIASYSAQFDQVLVRCLRASEGA